MTKSKEKKKKSKKKDSKKLIVTKNEFLSLRPVVSPFVQQKRKTDKDLLLKIDLRELKKKSLLRRIAPIPDTKKILLDKLGKEVFLLCDGKHKVKDIIKEFQAKYRLTLTETEIAVQKYLMSLTERHLIGFMIPEEMVRKKQLTGEAIEKVVIE